MGKASKWLRSFLTGKKDLKGTTAPEKDRSDQIGVITPATPKEKRRWSFRRSSATAPTASTPSRDSAVEATPKSPLPVVEREEEPKKHALTVAAATAAAADAAAAAAQAAAAVVRMTALVEDAAAVKIQAFFRSYLARKALRALKGLVKLQALVRGHLVRKRATATLRCMQALVTLQAKARAHRLRMLQETTKPPSNPRLSTHSTHTHRKSTQESRFNIFQENEENIKIVEMDIGEMNQNHHHQFKLSSSNLNREHDQQFHEDFSPAPSAISEMSPRAYSGYFEDFSSNYYSFTTAQNSPQCFKYRSEFYNNNNNADSLSLYDYPLFPNYMANTQSSRAKARSQSAPKQRPPELYERQPSSRRRASMEASRNSIQRVGRMQRSSSHMGTTAASKEFHHHYYPWMAIKLDRSNVSTKDSECGSTSTIMTNTNCCRSMVTSDAHRNMY